jgi:hypothetical protein
MGEMHITAVGPIVTQPASDTDPGAIAIEVLKSDGQASLVMSSVVAMELAAAIVKHLRQERSLSGTQSPPPENAE